MSDFAELFSRFIEWNKPLHGRWKAHVSYYSYDLQDSKGQVEKSDLGLGRHPGYYDDIKERDNFVERIATKSPETAFCYLF